MAVAGLQARPSAQEPASSIQGQYSREDISYRDLEKMMAERGLSVDHLEEDFRRQLNDPGIGGAVNTAEITIVSGDVGIIELRVVEDVEEFTANLEAQGFIRLQGNEIL